MTLIIICLGLALFWATIGAGIAYLCHANVAAIAWGVFLLSFCSGLLGMSLCIMAGGSKYE